MKSFSVIGRSMNEDDENMIYERLIAIEQSIDYIERRLWFFELMVCDDDGK